MLPATRSSSLLLCRTKNVFPQNLYSYELQTKGSETYQELLDCLCLRLEQEIKMFMQTQQGYCGEKQFLFYGFTLLGLQPETRTEDNCIMYS